MMEHDYKLYEEAGQEAHSLGKFQEWQQITSSIIESNPSIDKGKAAEQAYLQLVGSKEND
tara:strand:+ start:153 stop:332 length:180 start_codon:yes stop_codon:yes gene_type:complete